MSNEKSLLGASWTAVGLFFFSGVIAAGFFFWLVPPPYHHTSLRYLGSESCRDCHEAQYEFWAQTHMAQSFRLLLPGERADSKRRVGLDPHADFTQDARCLGCHTTGQGLVGGFTSVAATPAMAGVSCEACHGPGGRYAGTTLSPAAGALEEAHALPAEGFHATSDAACSRCHNDRSPFAGEAATRPG